MARGLPARKRASKANLSETAGADAFGQTLNPAKGQHRRGSDPSLRSHKLRQFGSNLGYPEAAFGCSMGGRLFEDVVLPGLVPDSHGHYR